MEGAQYPVLLMMFADVAQQQYMCVHAYICVFAYVHVCRRCSRFHVHASVLLCVFAYVCVYMCAPHIYSARPGS